MADCMNCGKPLTGRQRRHCSDKCRMALKRTNKTLQDGAGATKSNKPEQIHTPKPNKTEPELTDEMLASLPAPVVQPTAQPGSGQVPRVSWQDSPAYAKVIYNLLTLTLEELRARCQFIPVWRYGRGEEAMFKAETCPAEPAPTCNLAVPGEPDYDGVALQHPEWPRVKRGDSLTSASPTVSPEHLTINVSAATTNTNE